MCKYTYSSHMNSYVTTVIKIDNSYVLRVPKKYVDDAQLNLGQKVNIQLLIPQLKQDRLRIQTLLKQLQASGIYKDIEDPVAWQRAIRLDRPLPGKE